MAGIGELFGPGSTARQLLVWQVAGQVISALMAPALTEVQSLVQQAAPLVPIAPGQAADLAARELTSHDHAASEAAKGGVNGDRFALMVKGAQATPPLTGVLELWRRGLIPEDGAGESSASVAAALAELAIRPEWREHVKQLRYSPPSWSEALNALLQGQLPEDQARHWYQIGGGDPDAFTWLFNANGTAPTPVEALDMANRGLIPWDGEGAGVVSFRQAFLEGPWRNKWEESFRKLGVYLPPARTITAMLRNGSFTEAKALELFRKQGMDAETAAAYVADAQHSNASATKELTVSETLQLYQDQIIHKADAASMLTGLGYAQHSAELLLQLTDLRRVIAQVNSAVSRIRTLYTSRKIKRTVAHSTLTQLGVPAGQVADMLSAWDVELAATVRQLTPAQIVDAHSLALFTQAEAQAELEALGYTPRDAWVLLSIKNKKPLPDEPAAGPGSIA